MRKHLRTMHVKLLTKTKSLIRFYNDRALAAISFVDTSSHEMILATYNNLKVNKYMNEKETINLIKTRKQ